MLYYKLKLYLMKKRFLPFMTLILLTSLSFAQTRTIVVTVPDTTEVVYIAGVMNNWNTSADTMTKTSDSPKMYSFEFEMADTTGLKFKFLSGPDWKYQQVRSTDFVYTHDSVAVVDEFQAIYHKDQADSVTIEVLVPAEVYELNLTGNFNGWDPTANPMEQVDSSANGKEYVLKIFTIDTTTLAYKFVAGPGWPYEQKAGDFIYFTVGGIQVLDNVDDFKKIFDPNAVGDITINVTAPTGTDQVWLIGSFNNWEPATAIQATKNQDGTFTVVIQDVADIEYKCYSFNDWIYEEAIDATGTSLPNNRAASFITGPSFDVTVAFWKQQYEEPTAINDYETAKNLIYTRNGSIIVEGVVEKVSVIDVQGRMVQDARVKGIFTSKHLNAGIYIIRVDGKTKKVLLP